MLDHLLLMLSLLSTGQVGLATVFGSSSWDKHNPHSRLACLRREIDDRRDYVIAHKTLPCGTRLWIFNPRTGRSTLAEVADRGPLNADADLSIPVAKAIGHNGKEQVLLVPVYTPPPRRKKTDGAAVATRLVPAPVEETWDVPRELEVPAPGASATTPTGAAGGPSGPTLTTPAAPLDPGVPALEESWGGSGREEDREAPHHRGRDHEPRRPAIPVS